MKTIEPPASEVAPFSVALSEIVAPTLTVSSAVVVIDVGFLSTTKHSVVEFVWLPGRYFEPAAGVYSTRKQYVAMLAGVKASEVAVPPASVFVPRLVPPVEQSGVEFASKQVKNSTVPVAVPLLPVIVTVSVTESPIVM